jgi:hypothetical protein
VSDPAEAWLDELRRRFEHAAATGEYLWWNPYRNRWTRSLPLPRRVLFRLWCRKQLTTLGCWLVDHGHTCERLWRFCGMI